MNFFEFWSPIGRRIWISAGVAVIFSAIFFGLFQLVPVVEKTTVYFSVKVLASENSPTLLDPPESASKVAEAIAGWAKNPGFRNAVLERAGVEIANFKRKISARKQNRMNVFWTVKLADRERVNSEKISSALIEILDEKIAEWNKNSAFPFEISNKSMSRELRIFPKSWLAGISIFLGIFFGIFGVILFESATGRVSWIWQVRRVLKRTPLLRIGAKIGRHDKKVLQNFIVSFENPRLFSGFPEAEKHFAFSNFDDFDFESETPILIVKLGETKFRDLENFRAVFGRSAGVVVFEK